MTEFLHLLPLFVFLIKILDEYINCHPKMISLLILPFFIILIMEFLDINTYNYDIIYTFFIICVYYITIILKNKKLIMNSYICRYIIGRSYIKNIKRECNICMNYLNIMIHRESKMISSCHTCSLYLCVNCFSNLVQDKDSKTILCPICRGIIFAEIFDE